MFSPCLWISIASSTLLYPGCCLSTLAFSQSTLCCWSHGSHPLGKPSTWSRKPHPPPWMRDNKDRTVAPPLLGRTRRSFSAVVFVTRKWERWYPGSSERTTWKEYAKTPQCCTTGEPRHGDPLCCSLVRNLSKHISLTVNILSHTILYTIAVFIDRTVALQIY